MAGALLASGATFIQLGLVTAVANRSVMLRLLPTLAAGIAGFADVHAAVLSVATLAGTGSFSMHTTLLAGGLALLTNTTSKVIVAFAVGGRAFGTRFTLLLAVPFVVTSTVLLLTLNA